MQIKTTVSFEKKKKIVIMSEKKMEKLYYSSLGGNIKWQSLKKIMQECWFIYHQYMDQNCAFLVKSLKLCREQLGDGKRLLPTSGNLSSIPVTHRKVEGGTNHLRRVVLWPPHELHGTQGPAFTHTHTNNFLKF